jgi:hypothetical protein
VRQELLFEKRSPIAQGKEPRQSQTPAETAKDLGDGRVASAVSPFGTFSL